MILFFLSLLCWFIIWISARFLVLNEYWLDNLVKCFYWNALSKRRFYKCWVLMYFFSKHLIIASFLKHNFRILPNKRIRVPFLSFFCLDRGFSWCPSGFRVFYTWLFKSFYNFKWLIWGYHHKNRFQTFCNNCS